jgi:cobalt-zinc-cadmium efflux system membrane fusion protein
MIISRRLQSLLFCWWAPMAAFASPLLESTVVESTVAESTVLESTVLDLNAQQKQTLEIELYKTGTNAYEQSDPVAARLVINDRHQRVLTLPVSGTVQQLSLLPGARVEAGAELGLIHSPEALALQRQYLGAIDRLERTRASKKRDEALYQGGAISKKRWQQTRAEWRQGEAMVVELGSQLAAVGFTADELKLLQQGRQMRSLLPLRAPIKGVVLERRVQPGEAFAAGQELYHIGDPEQLWLAILAPQQLASRARVGDEVVWRQRALGRVLQVGAAIEQRSQSVMLTAELTQPQLQLSPGQPLLPGQSLLVQLQFTASEGLWLPDDSVVSIAGETVVFVAVGEAYEVRPVVLAPAMDGWLALSGLVQGEQVVASGSAALKGMVMGLGGAGDAH